MGWRLYCAVLNGGSFGYFASFPVHQEQRALRTLAHIYPRAIVTSGNMAHFIDEFVQPRDVVACGAYEHGTIICDSTYIPGSVLKKDRRFVDGMLTASTVGQVLIVELESVVNYFAYALYDGKALVRACAGDASNGILMDEGEMLSEERVVLEHAGLGRLDGIARGGNGEALAFQIAISFFGVPLDQFEAERLEVQQFWLRR